MLSWLWGGGGSAAGAQLSPALKDAQDALDREVVARIRARAPLEDDRALAAACGLPVDKASFEEDGAGGALVRSLASAVRAAADDQGGSGEAEERKPARSIGADALVVAYHRSTSSPTDWAYSVLAGGREEDEEGGVHFADVEGVLRGCLHLVAAAAAAVSAAPAAAAVAAVAGKGAEQEQNDLPSSSSSSSTPLLARALALGALAAQAEAKGSIAPAAASSSQPGERLSREGFARWAKHGSGVAIAQLLSSLLRRLGEEAAPPLPSPPPPWPSCPVLVAPDRSEKQQRKQQPLLLTPRAAFVLAPHVPDARRRSRWTLVYASQRHGKSWSSLKGRLAEAGASAAAAVERHLDEAAAAAAAVAGGGARARGGGRGARAGPAAGSSADAAAEAGGDAGPPATLVLVRNAASGAVFGGGAFSPWRRHSSFFGDASAFLFALSPAFRVHHASGINQSHQYFGTGFASLPNGLGMGGIGPVAGGAFGLFLDASLERGHSRPNATFACGPLCPASQDFDVADVEVWALLAPEEEDDGRPRAPRQGGGGVLGGARDADRNFLEVAGRFSDHSAGVRD